MRAASATVLAEEETDAASMPLLLFFVTPSGPAFVAADAPEENQPGACLVNGGEVGCEGAHHLTTRLCACA